MQTHPRAMRTSAKGLDYASSARPPHSVEQGEPKQAHCKEAPALAAAPLWNLHMVKPQAEANPTFEKPQDWCIALNIAARSLQSAVARWGHRWDVERAGQERGGSGLRTFDKNSKNPGSTVGSKH